MSDKNDDIKLVEEQTGYNNLSTPHFLHDMCKFTCVHRYKDTLTNWHTHRDHETYTNAYAQAHAWTHEHT